VIFMGQSYDPLLTIAVIDVCDPLLLVPGCPWGQVGTPPGTGWRHPGDRLGTEWGRMGTNGTPQGGMLPAAHCTRAARSGDPVIG